MPAIQPLKGIRVLDLSRIVAGPLCTQYLGDMGAQITKVESLEGDESRGWPPFDEGEGTIFLSVNRNKRSLALDARSEQGREILQRLAATADVLVESFGPGAAEKLGLGYQALRAVNPRLVYCSISGFGPQGPLKDKKGFDVILQAYTGMMALTGEPDGGPVRSPISPVDQATGIHAMAGILAALLHRGQTGEGVRVEAALFDTSLAFLAYYAQGVWARGREPERAGNAHESVCPYQMFQTADEPLMLGVATDGLWRRFCAVADLPDSIAANPQMATNAGRVEHRQELVAAVQQALSKRRCSEWLAILDEAGVPCAPIQGLGQALNSDHARASGLIADYIGASGNPLHAVLQPLRFNGERNGVACAPPRLGADALAILQEAGYSEKQVQALATEGVIRM